MTKLSPFYTDDKTAQAILAAVKDHKAQAQNGQITGAGASDVTTQFQNTCQFKLTADWKELSASNFVASGNKIVPLTAGAEKRPYPTTVYAYGEKPTSNKDSIIVATRRANRWVLLPTGSGGETSPKNQKVRLVQPKELFPACEYKTLQDVYGGALEYSDDGEAWIPAYSINVVGGRDVFTLPAPDASLNPHKHWRINLKGFAKPEDLHDPYADRGFYTFGRLWEALFWVKRQVKHQSSYNGTNYTFTADVANWQINTVEPVAVNLTLSPSIGNSKIFYRAGSDEWIDKGSFGSSATIQIPATDVIEPKNTTFTFKIVQDTTEVISITVSKPTYKLSPERPASFTLPESPVIEEANGYKITAKVTSHWQSSGAQVSVNIALDPPVLEGRLHYRCETGTWQESGAIHQDKTASIPDDDLKNPQNTFFEFAVSQYGLDVVGVRIPRPTYPISPDSAEIAMPPPREDIEVAHLFFDSKPTPRKAQNHRMWMLTFDQPETVTQVMLDVDRHYEHYVVCPGGRDALKQDISFVYSFDLTSERWTATTFPEMQKPMFNMDAKVVELADQTHQLVVLSGQVANGYSNIIQGYNFEKDYIQNVVDLGAGSLNFAGRPALMGDPMYRYGYLVNTPDGEWDFAKSLIVVGGSERSCYIRGTMSAIDSVLFSIQGSTLTIGCPYETSTLNITLSNVGNTGLPFGFFDYKTTINTSAGAVGTRFQNMGTYTRHQNLPVRGILRRRPVGNSMQPSNSNPVVDFLLIGGFNPVGREEYNTRVVSGIFHSPTPSAANGAQYSLLIQNPHFYNVNNENSLLYYPDSAFALGDCCAEYVEERDEVICFGGRANETDTAVAHEMPVVLDFKQTTPGIIGYQEQQLGGKWVYQKYPPMPHPRWSAASVLVKGLVRQGETIPCDRIFIIGGRNREGFVPEVDVFNLRYDDWETDWKGLDQGELEDFTPSGGSGGTTIIMQGGGDSVQSVKAGDNVKITGSSKNPVINAYLTWG